MSCCGKTKKIVGKARNIAKGTVAHVLGIKYEFTDGRIRICRGCPDNYWIAKTIWCSICKCHIPKKARVKDEKCPKDKWKS
jgi:hypothetical protein